MIFTRSSRISGCQVKKLQPTVLRHASRNVCVCTRTATGVFIFLQMSFKHILFNGLRSLFYSMYLWEINTPTTRKRRMSDGALLERFKRQTSEEQTTLEPPAFKCHADPEGASICSADSFPTTPTTTTAPPPPEPSK